MKPLILRGRKMTPPSKQRGVILLIALIMLVAMTLAGIGMMRSVDTGSVIAGNLAFKQATLNAVDVGINSAYAALMNVANSGNINDKQILNYNNGGPCPSGGTASLCTGGLAYFPGYYATPMQSNLNFPETCQVDAKVDAAYSTLCTGTAAPDDSLWWGNPAQWAGANTLSPIKDVNGTTIATVSYVIHRMCKTAGVSPSDPAQVLCQKYSMNVQGGSKTHPVPSTSTLVFYRITARSVGVRNSVSYAQALVLIAE